MTGSGFLFEFVESIDCRVQLALERALSLCECVDHVPEPDVADHHDVDVRLAALVPPSERAIHEREDDAVSQRDKRSSEHVDDTGRLREDGTQLRQYRRRRISPKVHEFSTSVSRHDPGAFELCKLALHWSQSGAGGPNELTQVERFVRAAQQPCEKPLPGLAKQDLREDSWRRRGRNHFGVNCNRTDYCARVWSGCERRYTKPWPSRSA
jgi:hypothetical protein